MKRILLLGCVLSSVLSLDCIGMEIKNGQLLSHKEWTTGNVNGFFKDETSHTKNKLFLLRQLRLQQKQGLVNDGMDGITIKNRILPIDDPIFTDKKTPINLSGVVSIYIENFTQMQKTYDIKTHLCVNTFGPMEPSMCFISADQIKLDPNGYVYLNKNPALSYVFPESGMYIVWSTTSIRSDYSTTLFGTDDADIISVINDQG